MFKVAFLVLLLSAGAAQADIYTWTDKNGVVNVSNLPPPEGVRPTRVTHEAPKDPAREAAAREAAHLAELRALVARAAVYIGGDSGPLHIAGTTTTPIVALLGPTLAERSMPWRDPRWFAEALDVGPLECRPCRQRECIPGDFRCLTQITADQVAAAAERALKGSGLITVREMSPDPMTRSV